MQPRRHHLKDGQALVIREAAPEDAGTLLSYVEKVSGESDFLTFGPSEFELTEAQEEDFLRKSRDSNNQFYLLALIDGEIVGSLTFSGGRHPRVRHSGEFGMTVRRSHWGLGIGALMLDALIEWAREGGVVKKINLRVRSDNQRAIALYKSKGFVNEGTIHREIFFNGTYFDNHFMGLEL